jgi:phospholipid transport system substrate-binding protein
VDRIINPHVDFDRVAILVLGKNWKAATPAQQDQFKKEFRTLMVRTYTTAFTEYSDWHINYLPLDEEPSDRKAMVKTEIVQSGGKPVAVNYRMVLDGGEWKVYDVLIEGVSLLQNYRSTFNSELEQGETLDQLIANLSQRNALALSGGSRCKAAPPESRARVASYNASAQRAEATSGSTRSCRPIEGQTGSLGHRPD